MAEIDGVDKGSLQDRYYKLLTLQKRVNHVLEIQADDGAAELRAADVTLAREVDKMLRLDSDPEIFKAIVRASWEAPDSEGFIKLAKITDAKIRLKALKGKYGTPSAFRKSIKAREEDICQKDDDLVNVQRNVKKLEKQLAPIVEHNQDRYTLNISAHSREKIEESGFWDRVDPDNVFGSSNVGAAYKIVSAYKDKYWHSNCFDDMEELSRQKDKIKELTSEIDTMQDKHYQNLAAYKDVRDLQKVLKGYDVGENSSINLTAFQEGFCKRLGDDDFIACFARETGSGVGGSIILAALTARIRHKIHDNLMAYKENVNETTKILEGPIGTIAKALNAERAIDGIERDINSQAMMAGYLCTCAAAAFKSLSSFRPEHTEGPISLKHDIHFHMVVDGGIDPAYIHEAYGMDRILTKHFNVNVTRPQPDFQKVLENPAAIERIDRHYAGFLRDHANDESVNTAGFSAGQFDDLSVQQFLGRYFNAGATQGEIKEELEKEASKVKENEKRIEKMEIKPDGPKMKAISNM